MAEPSWTKVSVGIEGLFVKNLAIDPMDPLVVYVGTTENGVFKSTNGGVSWLSWNNGLTDLRINALVLDPMNPKVVYVGTNKGVFKCASGSVGGIVVPIDKLGLLFPYIGVASVVIATVITTATCVRRFRHRKAQQ